MFGPSEYFWLACWGLTIIAAVTGKKNFIKGLIASVIGFMLALVGIDSITGTARYTFGSLHLYDGFDMLALVIGAFAASQVLRMANEGGSISKVGKVTGKVLEGLIVPFKHLFTLIRSAVIGVLFGAIPAVGMSAASFFSYSEAVRAAKKPERFGKGAEEGIIAPEAANNATVGGGLIPALTLGIPGTQSTAIMLGAVFAYGLRPGKDIFVDNVGVFYAIVIALVFSVFMIMVLGSLGANLFAKVTVVPGTILIPTITVVYFIGSYATGNKMFNIVVAVLLGIIGFIMKRNGYSLVSLLLAFVLAPIVEDNFVRARMIGGRAFVPSFLDSWLSIVLAALTLLSLIWAIRREFFKTRKAIAGENDKET
jgi:putative tricarboxylic transport membrane protein